MVQEKGALRNNRGLANVKISQEIGLLFVFILPMIGLAYAYSNDIEARRSYG
jgi:hypothetical protein